MSVTTELCVIPYVADFNGTYTLKDDCQLILNSMEVYILDNGAIDRKVAFDVVVNSEEKYILPRCNPEKYKSFLLMARRVVESSKLVINHGDYYNIVFYKEHLDETN